MARTWTATAGQNIDFGNDGNIDVNTVTITLSVWENAAAGDTAPATMLSKTAGGAQSTREIQFFKSNNTDNDLSFVLGGTVAFGTTEDAHSVWLNSILTIGSNSGNGYVNNNLQVGPTTPGTAEENATWKIGSRAGFEYNGFLAHTAIWTVVLSSNERAILARGINPFVVRNEVLTNYLPIQGNTSPEPNYGSSLNNGTIGGTLNKTSSNPPVELLENYL